MEPIEDVVAWYRAKNAEHAARVVQVPKPGRKAVRDRERARMEGRSKPVRAFAPPPPTTGKLAPHLSRREEMEGPRKRFLGRGSRQYGGRDGVGGVADRRTRRERRWMWFALTPHTRTAWFAEAERRELSLEPGYDGGPCWAEKAIAREQTQAAERRVALAQAAQRLDLVKKRDALNHHAGLAEAQARQARAELAGLLREGRTSEPSERLWAKALAAAQRVQDLPVFAASLRAQAAQLTLQIGKAPGKASRQERIALARQVGAAAA